MFLLLFSIDPFLPLISFRFVFFMFMEEGGWFVLSKNILWEVKILKVVLLDFLLVEALSGNKNDPRGVMWLYLGLKRRSGCVAILPDQ